MLKTIVSGAAVALALSASAAPAHATLEIAFDIGGSTFACADQAACDLNPAVGTLQIGDITLDGVALHGSIQQSFTGPDVLSTSSLIIRNENAFSVSGEAVVSDTNFLGPVTAVALSGAGVWSLASGSTTVNRWFADPANGQGAGLSFLTPGVLLDAFADTASGLSDSYSHDATKPFSAAGPFSMTEQVDLTLTAGGSLVNRGQTMTAVPEASTWVMLMTGFLLLAYAARNARPQRA